MSPEQFSFISLARRLAVLLLAAGAWAAAATPPVAPALPSQEQIDAVLRELSGITGMPVRHHLRFESISRPQLARYLDERSRATLKEEDIRAEETALKLLGFVPPDFDLRKASLALMTEQAAAFYDYHRKALFLSDWTPGSMRDTAVIHELAHALADQSFHLERFARKVQNDSERSIAREAVVEGQASYLMLAYNSARSGQSALALEPDRSNFDASVEPSGEDYPVFDHAPLYLRMSLVFPYTWGFGFQASVLQHFGREGFSEVFRHPPVSTRQILHPELYFENSDVKKEKPPRLDLPRQPHGYKTISDGELGELDHRVLLQQYVSLTEARELSPQWRAGVYRAVVSKGHATHYMLFYASEWADDASAARFLLDYRKILQGKCKLFGMTNQEADSFSGRSESGYFRVTRAGRRVVSTEGAAEPLL